ncbi:MAG TPA: flagellar basal body-associated FliL family protein [Magnetospirillaceae bacterium]|nr:flagellar basal body-associated FliL family protein [Magnetospirillaceae bacterium]
MGDSFDDQGLNISEDGGTAPVPARAKGGGARILRLLMWIGIALGAVIFVVTVVIVTVNIINRQGRPMTQVLVGEIYQRATPQFEYFTTLGEIRTRTIDNEPSSVVVTINLGFDRGDRDTPAMLTARIHQMRDLLRRYFSSATAQDLDPRNEKRIKEEIREKLNNLLARPSIREVLFERLDVIQM